MEENEFWLPREYNVDASFSGHSFTKKNVSSTACTGGICNSIEFVHIMYHASPDSELKPWLEFQSVIQICVPLNKSLIPRDPVSLFHKK